MPLIATPAAWARLLLAVAAIFAMFHIAAEQSGSFHGEYGIPIGVGVILAALLAERGLLTERIVFRAIQPPASRRDATRSIVTASVLSLALLAVFPIVAAATNSRVDFDPEDLELVPGLFAQAGLAEETLFRALLFGYVRRGRSFRRAVLLSALPFIAVHLVLFTTLPWPIALASVLLSAVISIPLAHLYELGGNTIWAPAIVHTVVQGAIKLLSLSPDTAAPLPIIWMAAAGTLPFAALLVRRPPTPPAPPDRA